MSTEYDRFDDIQIDGKRVVFVRDIQINPDPEEFGHDDALCLVTCPGILDATERAELDTYEDKYCRICGSTSVKYIPIINTYQISGKCPNK